MHPCHGIISRFINCRDRGTAGPLAQKRKKERETNKQTKQNQTKKKKKQTNRKQTKKWISTVYGLVWPGSMTNGEGDLKASTPGKGKMWKGRETVDGPKNKAVIMI